MIIQAGGVSFGDPGFGDASFEHNLLTSDVGVLATLDRGSEGCWRVNQVLMGVKMKTGFLLGADFHSKKVNGVIPLLRV